MNRRIGAAVFGTVLVLLLVLAAQSQHDGPTHPPRPGVSGDDKSGATTAAIREVRTALATRGPRGQHPDPVITLTGHPLGGNDGQARIAIEGRLASGVPIAFVVLVTRHDHDWTVAEVRP